MIVKHWTHWSKVKPYQKVKTNQLNYPVLTLGHVVSKCVNYETVLVWRLGHDIILKKHSLHLAQLHLSGTPQSRHYAQRCKSTYEKTLDFSFAEIVSKNSLITHEIRCKHNEKCK